MTRIVVVDDCFEIRQKISELIGKMPGLVCLYTCGSGEEAIEKVPVNVPDLILMDVHMPGISGVEATWTLKDLVPGIPIIMLTFDETSKTVVEALRAGACGYLLKTGSPEDIVEGISAAMHGGAPLSREIRPTVLKAFRMFCGALCPLLLFVGGAK